jgi:ribosomal protein S18 acetylase RimI-like enzyme
MNASVSARQAERADIPRLVELMREFYRESSYALDETWATAAFERLLGEPAFGAVWLVEDRDVPIGHVVLAVHFSMEFGGLCGAIDDLYVKPAYRRRGAGSAAIEAVIAECRRRGCRALSVEVGTDNRAARALYEKFGLVKLDGGRGNDARSVIDDVNDGGCVARPTPPVGPR